MNCGIERRKQLLPLMPYPGTRCAVFGNWQRDTFKTELLALFVFLAPSRRILIDTISCPRVCPFFVSEGQTRGDAASSWPLAVRQCSTVFTLIYNSTRIWIVFMFTSHGTHSFGDACLLLLRAIDEMDRCSHVDSNQL